MRHAPCHAPWPQLTCVVLVCAKLLRSLRSTFFSSTGMCWGLSPSSSVLHVQPEHVQSSCAISLTAETVHFKNWTMPAVLLALAATVSEHDRQEVVCRDAGRCTCILTDDL